MAKKESRPNYLSWWVVTLLVFVVFGVFVGSNDEPQAPLETDDEVSEVNEPIEENEKETETDAN